MLVKKYIVIFSLVNSQIMVLLDDNKVPSIEIGDKYTIFNYKRIIEKIYFDQESLILEHSDIHQNDKELMLVDFCLMFNKPPLKGEWRKLEEVLKDEEISQLHKEFIYSASLKG